MINVNHVILCGYTQIGRVIADRLRELGMHCVIVDEDEPAMRALRTQGTEAISDFPWTERAMTRARIDQAVALVAATNDDSANRDIAQTALRIRNRDSLHFHIVARIDNEEVATKLQKLGVEVTISPAILAGHLAASKVIEACPAILQKRQPSTGVGVAAHLASYSLSAFNILVVDDDRVERMTLRAIIAEAGYTVFDVDSGQEALDTLRESRIDLVLTDLFMGGSDGWELVDRVKKDYPEIHVVALTGNATVHGEKVLLSRRIDGYLVKPVFPRRLHILFRALLLPGNLDRTTEAVIVDRDQQAVDVMDSVLTEAGVFAKVFENPRKAMHYINEDPPNIVVTELDVDKHSGFELIEDIRQSRDLPYIPILAITANPSNEQIRRAVSLQVNGILTKPLQSSDFKKRVMKLLEQGTVPGV